ncbi:hypothetical protein GE300_13390 [Rhodobacteraceae bacterium 2CG4]|uniref:Uncharacterized protein n=1 Tax=Halovulum marinum TaxID=2662447 RepID=A0A6L5Z243_9RHOB|nr:hypothetical protein [Halovulum marinum]MSU90597.1 hypothetical protein [Halovulum marinum]
MQITGIPADAIDTFDQDGIEASVTGGFEQLGEADTTDEGFGGHGTIFEDRDLAVTFASQVASTELHLIFNGAVRLERGRVSGVDCGTALHS